VLLVRHGQASFGAADYDVLSDLGRRQAEIVAGSLAERGYRPARLVGGTLRRQRETAAALGAPAETFASLNRTLVNSSVTKLAIGSTGINVVSFNDHSHLETVDRALVTYR
jgi:phosphohistidine phosphatase SixA